MDQLGPIQLSDTYLKTQKMYCWIVTSIQREKNSDVQVSIKRERGKTLKPVNKSDSSVRQKVKIKGVLIQ
jgi:hypothetical protein